MALRTYQAYTMAELLSRIRQDLGAQAVIIHTRTFKRGGLLGIGARLVYEVTASDRRDDSAGVDASSAVNISSDGSSAGRRRGRSALPATVRGEISQVTTTPRTLSTQEYQQDPKQTILNHIDRQRSSRKKSGAMELEVGGGVGGERTARGGNGTASAAKINKKRKKVGRSKADDLLSALAELGQSPDVKPSPPTPFSATSAMASKGNRVNDQSGFVAKSGRRSTRQVIARTSATSSSVPKSRRPISSVAKRFILDPKTGRAIPVNQSPENVDRLRRSAGATNGISGISKEPVPDHRVDSSSHGIVPKNNTLPATNNGDILANNALCHNESTAAASSKATVSNGVGTQRETASISSSQSEDALHEEMAALRDMVSKVLDQQSQLVNSTANARLQESVGRIVDPDELKEDECVSRGESLQNYYATLIEHEVASELADDICLRIRGELSPAELEDGEMVRARLLDHLAEHFETAEPIGADEQLRPTDGRPLTMALIGATGVGKTTTVAKLAASYTLHDHVRVGLITTDTYRIAAVEQLRTYADIIGVPLKVAMTPSEIASACHALRDSDVILIDTAGRSPNDVSRIAEINSFITAAQPHVTHLVLSSASSEKVILRTIERFSSVSVDRIIFTKLDEAVNFGVIVNVMRKVGKKLSFITTGQEVPDQIERGEPRRLARLILGESLRS